MTKVTPPIRDKDSQNQPGKDGLDRPLVSRFYKDAAVLEKDGMFHVALDGRNVNTPAGNLLAVKWRGLAEAMCAEWNDQGEWVDPQSMPICQLANTAIDRVSLHMEDVRVAILAFSGSDLLCYRAQTPQELVDKQVEVWDPVLGWIRSEYDAEFKVVSGVMPLSQPEGSMAKIDQHLKTYDAFGLSGLHVLTSLTGSLFLALALTRQKINPDEAWAAAHIDEDWQIAQWGGDAEASSRRERRFRELRAANDFLSLIGG